MYGFETGYIDITMSIRHMTQKPSSKNSKDALY